MTIEKSMQIEIVKSEPNNLFDLPFLKNYLRVTNEQDDKLIAELLNTATAFVEEDLGKSIVKKTIKVTHHNNRFVIPSGPVTKIINVTRNGKNLAENDYKLRVDEFDNTEIETPFRWKDAELVIVYEAGYEIKNVPHSMKQAILAVLAYIYEHRGNLDDEEIYKQTRPWLHSYKHYSLF